MLARVTRPQVGQEIRRTRGLGVRASAAQTEAPYMAIMSLSAEERKIHSATLGDAASLAHNNIVMAKESEDLVIPPDVSAKGVKTLLETPSKGHFYVIRGHFTALYKHAKTESEKAGACGLRLYADDHNTKAHKTYEAMGMSSHYKVFEDLNTDY